MNTSLKWLITAFFIDANWGGYLDGRGVLRDFLGFQGTALSVPLSFMLIQLVIIFAALRPGLWTYPFVTEGIVGATVTLHPGEDKFVVNFGWDHKFK